jgi:TonB-linked SusC/RagA family outer membrane protein
MENYFYFHRSFIFYKRAQIFRVMKISLILLLVSMGSIYASAYSQNRNITLNASNISLKEVIKQIEQQSEYTFFYNEDYIDLSQLVSLSANKKDIGLVLTSICSQAKLNCKFMENNLVVITSESQQKLPKITGKVTDPDGQPMFGVTVAIKGTQKAALTDTKGNFILETSDKKPKLVFSYVGFLTQEYEVTGEGAVNIVLQPSINSLSEVVVTALGIKRDKKTLTYASQQVSGEELQKSGNINFMDALNGKAAGVDIEKSSSGAGGSTKVILRGAKSLTGLSEPLYVIDGIPMVNNKGGQPGMWGGTDQGDGLSQLNPDDIESINILKGSNASILYGSQGANGVVVIVTKKGKSGKAVVTFSSNTTFQKIISTPALQFQYGSLNGAMESWSTTKGNYNSSFVNDFFQTGTNLVNNLSISGGNESTTAYFSYSNTTARGVIPNNTYGKNNITFKQSTKFLNDKLTISSSVMLAYEQTNNRSGAGYYLNPLTGLYQFPRDRDFSAFKNNYQVFNKDRNMYLQNWFVSDDKQSNPYWIINNQPEVDLVKRIIASTSVDYDISKHFKFQARANIDYADKSYNQKLYAGSNSTNVSANGAWNYSKLNDQSEYTDALLKYDNKFENFSLNALVGTSYSQSVTGDGIQVGNGTTNLLYPNIFTFQNMPQNVMINSIYGGKEIKEGLFGNIQAGYKEMVFLDLSGRNDWASTLAGTGHQSYFYPALGVSAIISQMVKLPKVISFAKVRVSSSETANEVPFNVIHPDNTIATAQGGITYNTQYPFTDLKPEMIQSNEFGTEWRFFQGRAGFDFTYYYDVSTNQFLTTTMPSGSGYTTRYINIGKIVNKGIELSIDLVPVKTTLLSWNTSFNYATNNNKVVQLDPLQPNKQIDYGSAEGYTTYIKSGGSYGDLYGFSFQRNTAGQIMLDATNGAPLKSATQVYLGNLVQKWSLGWNNNINYKDWSLNFLVSGHFGGKCVSQTEALLDGSGTSQRTADARNVGYVSINAIKGTTAVTQIDPYLYYTTIGGRNGILEPYVYDRTNVRLSQLSVAYNFNVKKLHIPVTGLSFSLVAQNLMYLYKKAPFDPELAISTNQQSQSLDCFDVPATRTLGFNLKVTF